MASTAAGVVDLRQTLEDPDLLSDFRTFLRTRLDLNRSHNPEVKRRFEQWLDFVILCNQIFWLVEDQIEERIELMIQVGDRFLSRPPLGYNLALANQLNRKELVQHCKNLKERVTLDPDTSLLRPGYEYIFSNLSKKHDVFKKTIPRTTLHALLCAIS